MRHWPPLCLAFAMTLFSICLMGNLSFWHASFLLFLFHAVCSMPTQKWTCDCFLGFVCCLFWLHSVTCHFFSFTFKACSVGSGPFPCPLIAQSFSIPPLLWPLPACDTVPNCFQHYLHSWNLCACLSRVLMLPLGEKGHCGTDHAASCFVFTTAVPCKSAVENWDNVFSVT